MFDSPRNLTAIITILIATIGPVQAQPQLYFPLEEGQTVYDPDDFSSAYGPRRLGADNYDFHAALDIAAPEGVDVYPVTDGVVFLDRDDTNSDQEYIAIRHVDSNSNTIFYAQYLHVEVDNAYDVDDPVQPFAKIAEVRDFGNNGVSGDHLDVRYYPVGVPLPPTSTFIGADNPGRILGYPDAQRRTVMFGDVAPTFDPYPIIVDANGTPISNNGVPVPGTQIPIAGPSNERYFEVGIRTFDDELDANSIDVIITAFDNQGNELTEFELLDRSDVRESSFPNSVDYDDRINVGDVNFGDEDQGRESSAVKILPRSFSTTDPFHTVYFQWQFDESFLNTVVGEITITVYALDWSGHLSVATNGDVTPPGDDCDILIAANTTYTDATFLGQNVCVPAGVTLTINGTTTLDVDSDNVPSNLLISGRLEGTGTLFLLNGSEKMIRAGGVDAYEGEVIIDGDNGAGNVSCILVEDGGTLIVANNSSITSRNNGFFANDGGTYILNENAQIIVESSSSQPGITPGSRFQFGPGAGLVIRNQTSIVGTSASPIIFESNGSGQRWDGILVEGDSSALSYVDISGATEGIDVRARGVALDHITLSDNAYGLRTDYDCPVGCFAPARSEVTLSDSRITGSTYYGLYARNTDLTLSSSTVDHSGYYGLYATNATVDPVRDVVITASGIDPDDGTIIPGVPGRGVYLSASGELHLGSPLTSAPNRIANNVGHEVVAASGSYLFIGNQYSGTNAIFDATGGRLITNYGKDVIAAENVYWGDPDGPPSGAFYDAAYVDADPFEKTDPSGGAGAPFRQAPEESTVLAAASRGEAYDVGAFEYVPAHGTAGRGSGEWIAWLRGQIREVRQALQDDPGDEQALARLHRLVYLQRIDRDDAAGERTATRAVLRAIRRHIEGGGTLPPRLRRVAERALRAEVEGALADEEYERADSLYGAYAALVTHPCERLPLVLAGAALDEGRGRYAAAIAKVSEVVAVAEGVGTEEAADLIAVLEGELATLEALMEAAGSGARGVTASGPAAKSGEESGLPSAYALEAAYPNPFSRTATLPVALPEAADVRVVVYDMLGREVAVVAEERLEAGRHALVFDGSALASGVYIVRAMCSGSSETQVMTTRLTLMR